MRFGPRPVTEPARWEPGRPAPGEDRRRRRIGDRPGRQSGDSEHRLLRRPSRRGGRSGRGGGRVTQAAGRDPAAATAPRRALDDVADRRRKGGRAGRCPAGQRRTPRGCADGPGTSARRQGDGRAPGRPGLRRRRPTSRPWPTRSASAASKRPAFPTSGSCRPGRPRSSPWDAEPVAAVPFCRSTLSPRAGWHARP